MIELYDYQKEQIKKSQSRWFFQMGMGTGKTYTALGHYLNHATDKPHLIIVAPKAVATSGDWADACESFGIDSFEVWRTDDVKKRRPQAYPYWLIVDEGHKFKAYNSQRGKAVQKLASEAIGWSMLSGTFANGKFKDDSHGGYALAGGKWEDMANFAIITGLVKNITEFRRRFGQEVSNRWSNYPSYKYKVNITELSAWWGSVASDVITIDDVQELPAVQDFVVKFPKARWKKDDMPIFETNSEKRVWERVNSNVKAKSEWLHDFIEDTTDGVVIFYNFNAEREVITDVLSKFKDWTVKNINGSINELSEVKKWTRTALVVQVKAGGAGLNLQGATHAIWWGLPDSYTDYEQSRFRIYRSGQDKHTTRTELVAGIDNDIKQALDEKRDWNE